MHNETTADASRARRSESASGVATGQVANAPVRPSELDLLNALIGRWLTEGSTEPAEADAVPIFASDVYEWLPGRHFVLHTAYGRIGEIGVGGVEIIGHDAATGQYRTWFFDSQGNTSSQTLTYSDGDWIWEGPDARCTGEVRDDGRTMIARH
jgi:hypothetical protein